MRSQKSGVRRLTEQQNNRTAEQQSKGSKSTALLLYCSTALIFTAYCLMFTNIALAGQEDLTGNIRKAIAKELSNTVSSEVEIDRMRIIRGIGNLENIEDYRVVRVVMNGYSGRNRAVFLVHLLDRLNRKRTISVEAFYDVVVDVFVTARPIRRGQILTEDDFYAVRQRASRLPVGALLSSKDIAGKSLKVNIGQGVIIRSNHVTDEQIVRRGQRVNVVVERGNIVITTQGVLRSNTAIGDIANVLTDNTRKEVIGILVSGDTVRVQL